MIKHKSQGAISPFYFVVLQKSYAQKHVYKVSPLESMGRLKRKRNLLFFSVVYGVIIGSLLFMLLNA